MADYCAPLCDMRFLLNDVFRIPSRYAELPKLAGILDDGIADAILEEAGRITAAVVAPLNRSGDEEGCSWQDGKVTTPAGFPEAYRAYAQGGWPGVGGDPAFGGMGMPKVIAAQIEEMVNAANLSFGLYPMLTAGACLAIHMHGSEALKQAYLPPMHEGRWSGSMCLTEPQAGTDLGLIKTRAEPGADAAFRLYGTKIFITGGEHDLTENIVHLVLARLPDAPPGPKGISLFLVPKFLVDADGRVGERNAVSCGSIEHKMGIKASSTCVMNIDGATGYLVGEPHRGLAAMFTMMNYERLGVGIQGLALGERSYQTALAYARERVQGKGPGGATAGKGADPILVHPDVRRMLLTMKALNEGGRAFSTYVATQLDIARYGSDAALRERAESLVALLTPVVKAFLTDMGLETTVHGQQVLGGHGYVREWGQEQLVRDCRITQIYEGTNGIQALDLLARKVGGSAGALCSLFTAEIRGFVDADADGLAEFADPLIEAVQQLEELTTWLLEQARTDPDALGAASVEYLHVFGYTAYAYMWARMARTALDLQGQDEFASAKLATARFYFARLLPRTASLIASIRSGSGSLKVDEAWF